MAGKVTVNGLVKFMSSSSRVQRTVVRDFKYPKGEGYAMASYYGDARKIIRDYYHKSKNKVWLAEQYIRLKTEAEMEPNKILKVRFRENARAVNSYTTNFSDYALTYKQKVNASIECGGVNINIHPDLFGVHRDNDQLIFINWSKKELTPECALIYCYMALRASESQQLDLRPASCLCFDLINGEIYKAKAKNSRLNADIEAACETFSDIWMGI